MLFNINKFVLTILKIKIIKILEFIEFFADFSFLVQSVILAVNFINNQTEHRRTRWIAALNYKAPQEQFFFGWKFESDCFYFYRTQTNEWTDERTNEGSNIHSLLMVGGYFGVTSKIKNGSNNNNTKKTKQKRQKSRQTNTIQLNWIERNPQSESHSASATISASARTSSASIGRRSALSANCQLKKLPQISSSLSSSS